MRWIVVCVFALFSFSAHATQTILIMGDSLSSGYGLPVKKSWPSLLIEKIRNEELDYNVVNASITGETSSGGARRIQAALAKHHPSVVIIALGGNDGLRGLSLTTLHANLQTMIRMSQASGARVLLAGMRLPPNYGIDYVKRFTELYRTLAKETHIALVPFLLAGFAEQTEFFQADGIHPNVAAQPRLVDNIWPHLRPLLDNKHSQKSRKHTN